jgi:hypothetical protein
MKVTELKTSIGNLLPNPVSAPLHQQRIMQ